MSANDRQVGGDHYADGGELQHWDLIERYGLGYLEGCATKYLTRFRKKNGLEDVKKSLHYVQKLAELHAEGVRRPRGCVPLVALGHYIVANKLTGSMEGVLIYQICRWEFGVDLALVDDGIRNLITKLEHEHP